VPWLTKPDERVRAQLRQLSGAHEQSLTVARHRAGSRPPSAPTCVVRTARSPCREGTTGNALRIKRRKRPAKPASDAPLTRAARSPSVMRESLCNTENILTDLDELELHARNLSGPEVAELLFRRFNPSLDQHGLPAAPGGSRRARAARRRPRGRWRSRAPTRADSRVIDRRRRQPLASARGRPRARPVRLLDP